jgi:molybdopterin converting factor subunit 1
MHLNIRLFATLKDRAGVSQVAVELSQQAPTVADLLSYLGQKMPVLLPSLGTVIVAVNQEFSFSDQLLHEQDDIVLFPPVSGG